MRIPSPSAVSRSSSPEQSIPLLTTPIFSVRSIRRSPGSTAPGQRDRHALADGDVRGPAHDVERLAAAERHAWSATAGRRAGGAPTVSSSPTTTFVPVGAPALDALDLHPEQGQALGQLLRGRARCRRSRAARTAAPSSELLQEAQVVLEEQAQVGDAVAQHLDPLRAHAEGEALVALRDRGRRTGARPDGPCRPRGSSSSRSGRRPGQPEPPHTRHSTSNATDGSVNG